MHYNFVRIHQTLRNYARDGGGVTRKLWWLTDMVLVIEGWETSRSAQISGDVLIG
jgi:hypothetical protein